MIKTEINDAELTAALAQLNAHLSDMTPVFEVLGDLLEDSTERRFEEGISPDGVAWAPKTQATLDAYKRRGQTVSFKPLFGPNVDGLPLRKSFFHDAGPDRLEVGTNKIQAAVMQFGAAQGAFGKNAIDKPIPWGNIPARPYLGISQEDRTQITLAIEEWLEEAAED